MSQFSDKRDEKVVRENTYLLKLEIYNIDRKMKSIIRGIFISIIMYPNFMHFRQKINFKSELETCTLVSGHLKTALNTSVATICKTRNQDLQFKKKLKKYNTDQFLPQGMWLNAEDFVKSSKKAI